MEAEQVLLAIDTKLGRVDSKLDRFADKFDELSRSIYEHDARIEQLEHFRREHAQREVEIQNFIRAQAQVGQRLETIQGEVSKMQSTVDHMQEQITVLHDDRTFLKGGWKASGMIAGGFIMLVTLVTGLAKIFESISGWIRAAAKAP